MRVTFHVFCIFAICASSVLCQDEDFLYDTFPVGFKWGFATASYQIEGGWNASGKGENIWDEFTHRNPSPIVDNSTGDIACDSYNKYMNDVELLKNMGANFYRFSLSWSRILPKGTADEINQDGIDYYNKLIDALLDAGIEPMVTLYHWDLPQPLQALKGGWPGGEIVDDFANYSRIAYEAFGDRVKSWITFNEPWVVCINGFATGAMAPGIVEPKEEPYKCAHTIIKAHARAYHIYQDEFKATQGGLVGITLDVGHVEPANPQSQDDINAAERAQQFKHGWFGSPVFFGKYPDIMVQLIGEKSAAEGLPKSRLPEFDGDWPEVIKGTWDFLGLNHYTTELATNDTTGPPGWFGDRNSRVWQDPSWPASSASWLKTVPWGFRKVLNWLKKTYGNPEIYVTENGFADYPTTGLVDDGRVYYYYHYINNMLRAIKSDGVNVTRYTAWSLMDNFEWARGYSERFGTHYVDFENPERPRTPKKSAQLLKKIFADHGFLQPDPTITTTTTAGPTTTTDGPTSTTAGPTTTTNDPRTTTPSSAAKTQIYWTSIAAGIYFAIVRLMAF